MDLTIQNIQKEHLSVLVGESPECQLQFSLLFLHSLLVMICFSIFSYRKTAELFWKIR